MEKLNPISVKQMIINSLTEAIIEGQIAPGTVLTERNLSLTLGVSRTPVREALQVLTTEGFINGYDRKGWSVSVPDVDTIKNVFGFRAIIEGAGIESVFNTFSEKKLAYVGNLFSDIDLTIVKENKKLYLERDRELHQIIVASLDNSRVLDTFHKLNLWVDWVRNLLPPRVREESGLTEHKNICSAIANKEVSSAKELLIDHIKRAERDFIQLMTESQKEKEKEAQGENNQVRLYG